ncbi:MAG: VIT domain-containing protein [Acidimicrobiia bacterium]|nr:MAG: VIT domain-containing protein [Acidimicrobiia bacterium]
MRAALAAALLAISLPSTAAAQTPSPLPPCPWWHCGGPADLVVEEYRLEVEITDGIATTRVRQVLRNDGDFAGEGEFLHPIPVDATVTGLTLWIDGEPVAGELLGGDAARQTYEDIVRRTQDPALLEWADDALLRLRLFPIEAHSRRTVEIEYRQALASDHGLARYRHPLGREHAATIESLSARIEIASADGVKTVYSPSHDVGIDRISDGRVVVGYEASEVATTDLVLYHSTGAGAVDLDVVTYRDGEEGWFLLLASPGLEGGGAVVAKDLILVLDVSGSMEGEKFIQARDAAAHVLDGLNPGDRFEVIAFSTGTTSFGDGLRPASEAPAGRDWLSTLAPGGSTNIDLALEEALDRAEPGRPAYVVFLTDGLPTEGVVDTATILENLDRRSSDQVSIFAFGVGYDVDTFLLDSMAREHHGSTTYVTPDEAIDAAIESLYSRISSPVLTGVSLTVSGVTVSDLQPQPLPDVFRGGQLVAVGRYTGAGPATITLTGRSGGDEVRLVFDDVLFTESGGDPSVPRLWAGRKIGELLRSVRLDGPDPETIDQIVRLSIRWGIVTPYTSYLVTEDAPFGEQALEDISSEAARQAADTPTQSSGKAAVDEADAAAGLVAAERLASMPTDLVILAGDRTLLWSDGRWIDTLYDPQMPVVRISFGSVEYFSLAQRPEMGAILAAAAEMIVVADGVAYEVVPSGEPSDPLPESTTAAEPTTSTVPGEAFAPPASSARGEFPVALLVIGAAIASAAILAFGGIRRHR